MQGPRSGLLVLILALVGGVGAGPLWTGSPDGLAPDAAPRGVHLSLVGDARTTMTVTWFTDGPTDPGSLVQYGTGGLERVTEGTAHAVEPSGQDVLVHEAHLVGLAPGATYLYRVGAEGAWSDVRTFRTDDGDGAFRFVVFGDHGTDEPDDPPLLRQSTRTTGLARAAAPDLALIAGDLSYANGHQPTWDVWYDQLEPLAGEVAVMPAIGNHEWEGTAGSAAFRSRLALPGAETYYSFDYGRIHFLVLQSDLNGLVGDGIFDAMVLYAEADLQDAAERRTRGEIDFLVIMHHHPLYSNHPSPDRKVSARLVATEEHWMVRYGVDLLLVGHDHYYDRSRPMVVGTPTTLDDHDYEDPIGTIMVVSGGGGQSLYDFDSELLFYPWSATHAKRYHFVQFQVDGGRIDVTAVSTGPGQEGEVFDAWSLVRGQSSSSTSSSARQLPWPSTVPPVGVQ